MRAKGSGNNASLDGGKLGRELSGLFSIFFGLLLMLSLATFDSRDPWLNHVVSGSPKIYNKAGLFGAYTGGFLLDVLGYAAWIVPAFFCLVGARRILGSRPWPWWRWSGALLMAVVVAFAGASGDAAHMDVTRPSLYGMATHGGGLLGHFMYGSLVGALSPTGAWLMWTLCLLLAVQMLIGFSWLAVVMATASTLWRTSVNMAEEAMDNRKRKQTSSQAAVREKPLVIETTAKDAALSRAVPVASSSFDPSDDYPLQATEDDIFSSFAKEDDTSKNVVSRTEGSVTEEAELPPWVKDFEEGKLGLDELDSSEQNRTVFSQQSAPAVAEPKEQTSAPPVIRDAVPGAEAELTGPEAVKEQSGKSLTSVAVELIAKALPKIMLPPLGLIEDVVPQGSSKASRAQLEEKGKILMTCLTDFGIQGELVGITPGPVVTMFEVRPAPGVRVSRIANLSDDLALALKAVAVRIQAPVPGTDTVGIEIPNEVRETVGLKELLASEAFQHSRSLLTLAIGKDIAGHPAVADLATMPHLLVAGATGAGKSVGINSIILSILYKAKPDEVRLLLVDPKRVEMAIYADLPHLVHPVVTEMQLAKNALDWAVREMEQRYSDIARAGVRNIGDYNAKLKKLGTKRPEGMEGLEVMPYLVIIIDELADLMLVAAKEVETSIVRLAQLARAAGIHLILATQRPSVDVVTGIIKANFPCRISFQVTSKHDSRTILDTVGAEHLLGKGDMLFKPSGGRFQRMHGAFVSDRTVQSVVDFWKAQQKPVYSIDFADWGADGGNDGSFAGNGGGDIASDPAYAEAVDFVRQQGKASISLIQRRFRIGFNKAARFVEQMEQDGVIGPADGSKPRQVLR